jgi:leader peptidase (prepilin peptidase)/N-methyltransferase
VTWFLDTALVAGGIGLVSGAFVPSLIARVPEPDPDPEPAHASEGDGVVADGPGGREAADDEADFARSIDDPKEPYRDVAALPGLRWKAALASALAAGAIGGRLGWHPALLFLLYLVPVCVALSVIDWRTRLLPTYVIAPSYVVVGVLAVLASAVSSDWHALVVATIGWLSSFVVFFVLWFISPRGLGYGDVRLSGVLGMALGWLGVPQLVLGMYTGFLLGGVGGLLLSLVRLFHRKHYPFGPFMVAGAFLAVVLPGELATLYGWVVNGLTTLALAVADAF